VYCVEEKERARERESERGEERETDRGLFEALRKRRERLTEREKAT